MVKSLLTNELNIPLVKTFTGLNLLYKPLGNNILVLSPHKDDETIGCGGVLIKHVQSGDIVTVLYFTSGINLLDSRKASSILARNQENQRALEVLRVTDVIDWSERDSGLKCNSKMVTDLRKIIVEKGIDLIYVPHFFEEHPDHKSVSEILLRSYLPEFKDISIAAYEVWNPLVPNVLVDITDVYQIKIEAIRCYRSQIILHNIENMVSALNSYRASFLRFRKYKYAEAFYINNYQQYKLLAEEYYKFYDYLTKGFCTQMNGDCYE